MKFHRTLVATALGAALTAAPFALPADAVTIKTFKNCTEMHEVYPHGVGKKKAKDKTSGEPVTTFYKNDELYAKNTKSDRDKDGIACEKG